MAGKITAQVPEDTPLWVQDSGFRQFWFYLEPQARFFWPSRELDEQWSRRVDPQVAVLFPEEKAAEFLEDLRGEQQMRQQLLLEIPDRRGDRYELWLLNSGDAVSSSGGE
jgi:hypothetical protein